MIAGISYSGKTQDDSIDVEVVAIAEDGAQIPVNTYRVKPGQSVSVDLSKFGITPMTLRGFVRPTEQ